MALAAGANIIEKHIILIEVKRKRLLLNLNPEEFKIFVRNIKKYMLHS